MKKVSVLLVAALVSLSGLAKADGGPRDCGEGWAWDEATHCCVKAEKAAAAGGMVNVGMSDEALEAVNKAAKDGAKEGAREAIKEAAQPTKAIKPAAKKVAKPAAAKPCNQRKLQDISTGLDRIDAMAKAPLRAEELEKLRGQVEAARQAAFECVEPDLVSRAAQLAKKLAGLKADPDPIPAAGTTEAPKANEEKAEGGVLSGARTCTEWCQERNRGDGEMRGDRCFCLGLADGQTQATADSPEEKGWCSRHPVACTFVIIGSLAVAGGVGYLVYDTQRDYHVTRGSLRQPLRGLPGQPQGFGLRF